MPAHPPGITRTAGVDRRVLATFLVLALLLLATATLASQVAEGDIMAFDRWLIDLLRDDRDPRIPEGPDWLRRTMTDVTALGGGPVLTLLTIGVAGYLVAIRKASAALFVIAAVASGSVAGTLLKLWFLRPRPDIVPHLVEVQTASFPSSHAMNSAITYLTLAALINRTQQGRRVKLYLMSAAMQRRDVIEQPGAAEAGPN